MFGVVIIVVGIIAVIAAAAFGIAASIQCLYDYFKTFE